MNMDYVIVNVNGGYANVYDFCTLETAQEIIDKATERAKETVETYNSHIVNYPERADYWRNCKKEYESAKYEMMTFNEYLIRQKKSMVSGEVSEVTEENYNDALNCLSPLKWCNRDGFELFCMCEMYTGTYTTQYAKKDGKYYSAIVDTTDENTWIHNRL